MIDLIIKPVIRHGLTVASGVLVAKYGIEVQPSALDLLAAGITAAIGIGWSVAEKLGARRA